MLSFRVHLQSNSRKQQMKEMQLYKKTCNTLPVVTKPGGNVIIVYRYLTV